MSAILECTPEPAPPSVGFVTGTTEACGTDVAVASGSCALAAEPSDLFYRLIPWTGVYAWQARDIVWDTGLFGAFTCQIEDWTTLTMVPSDRWENIHDWWSTIGTY